MPVRLTIALLLIALISPARCGAEGEPRWAIALHGGAGKIARDIPEQRVAAYRAVLNDCLDTGVSLLRSGGAALDVAEAVVMKLEDFPLFNAGRGSVFDRRGGHSMDASIMIGGSLDCGGVAAVKSLRNPIQAARLVMEQSPHVLMTGADAESFASKRGAALAPLNYFSTRYRFEKLQAAMRESGLTPPEQPLYGWPESERNGAPPEGDGDEAGGTVGCVVLDTHGELVAATSTGGLNNKLAGRIGDSPIPGAGNYANASVAVGGTGKGEQYLRHVATARVALLVESREMTVDEACRHVLENVLNPGDGGFIAVGRDGSVSLRSTTGSMPSAAADSAGYRSVAIWYD